MLRQQDVGHRVVVRRIVGVTGDRALFTDALGELVDLTETDLTLATAKGTVRVPLREVHRAKRVPPARRAVAADVISLELAADEAWPAPVRSRLGGWILRAADNWTGRANSALAVGDPDRPLDEAIDAVVRWYTERGQQPLINAPMPLAAPVNAALDERGWTTRPLTLVQTMPLAALLKTAAGSGLPPVDLADAASDEWYAMVAEHKGALPGTALRILNGVPERVFAHVRDTDGGLLAVARGAVTGPDRWLGISLLQTAPAARRQGLGAHVVRALAQWASQRGSTRAYLQVEERNAAAVALYNRLGFTTHHTYLTRQL
ncbi:putative GCN5-related N-acetyltransferase [Actinoplanes missouriensis 431]|uniref:Putative GCN5-related N-acetyltransferase n=1 Tax=Actinoplanes missouriensis (strain ATCC 14538 / DSM 43046 / CBS 188.64 / JCM 3121 / NBRC 102363 / NCIMB 12654 / NRRL B-3342 / UNCC 431) TaxID=512565 RepID=I0HHU9_ACTM4|nr:GNAT family N-acetyltransferase [Actinoplanes missouriensis]BAL92586.1 putative GCN5-related N-acetyltransferase [Actinoplanes missouriensis 431]